MDRLERYQPVSRRHRLPLQTELLFEHVSDPRAESRKSKLRDGGMDWGRVLAWQVRGPVFSHLWGVGHAGTQTVTG